MSPSFIGPKFLAQASELPRADTEGCKVTVPAPWSCPGQHWHCSTPALHQDKGKAVTELRTEISPAACFALAISASASLSEVVAPGPHQRSCLKPSCQAVHHAKALNDRETQSLPVMSGILLAINSVLVPGPACLSPFHPQRIRHPGRMERFRHYRELTFKAASLWLCGS